MRTAALILCATACGPTPFTYDGTAGTPVPAHFGSDTLADVSATINGGAPIVLTVDTGAPLTTLDSTKVPDHPDGKHIDDIAAFNLVFHGVLDVSRQTFGDTAGVLGGDILHHFAFTLDYEGDRVWLSDPFDPSQIPSDVKAGPEKQVIFTLKGGGTGTVPNCTAACGYIQYAMTRVMVQASFEGATPVWILIDSGASGVILPGDMYSSLRADPNRPRLDGIGITAIDSGSQEAFMTRVSSLELQSVIGTGTLATADVVAIVLPGTTLLNSLSNEVGVPTRALIGATLLDHYLTTVDYQSAALRFRKYNDADTRGDKDFLGPGFGMDNSTGAWRVYECYTNKDAYAQGIRIDDVIDQIDNTPLTGMSPSAVQGLYGTYHVGDTMHITYARGASTFTADVLFEDLLPHYPPRT